MLAASDSWQQGRDTPRIAEPLPLAKTTYISWLYQHASIYGFITIMDLNVNKPMMLTATLAKSMTGFRECSLQDAGEAAAALLTHLAVSS